MSQERLQQLRAKQRLAELRGKASAPAAPEGDALGAAVEGFGQGAAMGYLPQLQAAAGQLVPNPGANVDADLESQGFTINQGDDSYLQLRDENLLRQERLAASNPYIYGGSQVAGMIATAPAIEAGIAKALPGAGRLARAVGTGAAVGAVQNPGDEVGVISPLQLPERGKNAAIGGVLGGGLDLAARGAGSIGKKIVESGGKLETLAEKNALRSAGAQKTQLKKLTNQNRVKDVGRFIIDEDLVPVGAGADDVMERAVAAQKKYGTEIASVFDDIEKSGSAGTFKRKDLSQSMRDSLQMDDSVGGSLDADEVMGKLEKYIANFEKKEGAASAKELLELKGKFDSRINYSKKAMDTPELQQAYKNIRSTINEAINDRADALSNKVRGELGTKLKEANRKYGLASSAKEIAENKVNQDGNRFISLSDSIAGSAAGAAGLATMGPSGLALAAAGALGNKAMRTYGPKVGTSILDAAGKGLKKVAGKGANIPALVALRIAALEESLEPSPRKPLRNSRRARLKAMGE